MTPEQTILAAILVPLAGAVLIGLTGRSPNLRETVTLITAGLLFLLVLSLVPGVMAGERPAATVWTVIPGLTLGFMVEPLGMLFALIASGLWIVNSIYSFGYMRAHHEPNQTRFYICFAIALASTMGVAFAGNLFTLFLFYEALTLSTYPLVTHHGDQKSIRAGRVYLIILIGTSVMLFLTAIAITWTLAGTLDFRPGGILAGHADPLTVGVLVGLFAFGIGKAALMPIHRWLPAAMVAPTPVSALLHAVAVVKAGVFAVLKITVYVFGLDLLTSTGASQWIVYVAAASVVIASLIALSKDNLKARLAYSTVSQLAYVVLGASLATAHSVVGGGMQIAMHAFGKITLFFCAGAIYVAAHKTEISDMAGIGRTMPITMAAFLIGALSIVGLPPFGGAWSKWYLMLGAAETGQLVVMGVLMLSSLLSLGYLLPIVARGFFLPPGAGAGGHTAPGIREAPLACLIALCLTATGCLVLFFFAEQVETLVASALPADLLSARSRP